MATIANLVVKLGIKGAQKSRRAIEKFSKSAVKGIEKVTKTMKTVAKVTATALAGMVASFGLLAKSAGRSQREISAWAESLDMSVASLQKWQYAAADAGLEGDKIADIFKDINDKLGDFILTGGGEAADVLKRIGISAKDIEGLKAPEALDKIWKSIQNLSRQKQTFVLEAIGNDASKMIPLLEKGGAKLRKLFNDYDELGAATSQKQSKALLELDGSLRQTGQLWKAFKDQLSAAVAPAIVNVVEKVKAWVKASGGMKNIATEIAEGFLKGVEAGVKFFSNIMIGSKMAIAGIKMIGLTIQQIFNEGMAKAMEFFGYVAGQYARWKETTLTFFEERRERQISDTIGKFGKGALTESDRVWYEQRQELKKSGSKGKNAAQLGEQAAAPYREAAKAYRDSTGKLTTEILKLRQQLTKDVLKTQDATQKVIEPIKKFGKDIRKNTGVADPSGSTKMGMKLVRNGNSFSYEPTQAMASKSAAQAAGTAPRRKTADEVKIQVTTDHELFVKKLGTTAGFSEIVGEEIVRSTSDAARQVSR